MIKQLFFYDTIKNRMILEKNQVIHDIKNSFSRATIKNLLNDWNENDEHWAFTSHSNPNGIQFQATNCAKCGDYIMFNSDINPYYNNNNNNRRNTTPFSDKIFCKCNCNCNETEDDYEYDSDYYREFVIERDYQYENERNSDFEFYLESEYDYEPDCDLECYE
jgi:hypothetical protein